MINYNDDDMQLTFIRTYGLLLKSKGHKTTPEQNEQNAKCGGTV
jgi:hypothetical protein